MGRFDYTKLTPENEEWLASIRKRAEELERALDRLPRTDYDPHIHRLDRAYHKLEECVMWVGKALKMSQELSDHENR